MASSTEERRKLLEDHGEHQDYHSLSEETYTKLSTPSVKIASGSTSTESHGVKSFHIVFVAFIGSVGIAFSVMPILIPYETHEKLSLDIIPVIGRAWCSSFTLLISAGFIIWKFHVRFAKAKVQRSDIPQMTTISEKLKSVLNNCKKFCTFVIRQCPSLLQVFVFATGSICTCALDILNNEKLREDNERSYVEYVAYLFQDVSRLLSLFIQMFFFSWFVYENHVGTPYCSRWHHLGIAVMIGAQVWLWVSDTSEPLGYLNDHDDVHDCVTVEQINLTNSENLTGLTFKVVHFLEPFHVEFLTISIGLLYELWCTSPPENKQQASRSTGDFKSENSSSKTFWKVHIFTAAVLSLIYTGVSSVVLFGSCPQTHCTDMIVYRRVMIYHGIQFLFFGAFLPTCTFYALWKLGSSRIRSPSGSISQYMLVITAVVVFVYYTIRIFAAGYALRLGNTRLVSVEFYVGADLLEWPIHLNQSTLTYAEDLSMDVCMIVYPCFIIVQVWTQTQLLIEAQRRDVPEAVKICFIYIIAMNFGEWLQTGISLGFDRDGTSQMTPITNDIFKDEGARTIRLILYPFMVLYRFHSAVVAWEIILEDIDHNHNSVQNEKDDDDNCEESNDLNDDDNAAGDNGGDGDQDNDDEKDTANIAVVPLNDGNDKDSAGNNGEMQEQEGAIAT